MTYTELADDILSTLGMNHDDAVRSREAVLFNISIVANRLRRQRLEKELSYTGDRGSTGIATTYVLPLFQEDFVGGRLYFKLPSQLLDIKQNAGVSYITYHHTSGCKDSLIGRHFTLCTPAEADVLQGMEMQRPSNSVPYYYPMRIHTDAQTFTDRMWVLGVSPLTRSLEVGLYLALDLSDPMLDLDDPSIDMDLQADQVLLIKRNVLELERFALLVPQERLKNDGRDFPAGQQPLQPPHMASLNDPLNLSEGNG